MRHLFSIFMVITLFPTTLLALDELDLRKIRPVPMPGSSGEGRHGVDNMPAPKKKSCKSGHHEDPVCVAKRNRLYQEKTLQLYDMTCNCVPISGKSKQVSRPEENSLPEEFSLRKCEPGWALSDKGKFCAYPDTPEYQKKPFEKCFKDEEGKYLWLCPKDLYTHNPSQKKKSAINFEDCTFRAFKERIECPEGTYYWRNDGVPVKKRTNKRVGEGSISKPDPSPARHRGMIY